MPRYVSAFLSCFIFGVGIASIYFVSIDIIWLWLLCGLFLGMVGLLVNRSAGFFIVFMVLGVATGIWYVNQSFKPNEYNEILGKSFEAEGIIATDPVGNGTGQQVTLLPDDYTQYIRASLYKPIPGATLGDRVWIRGQVELPANFSGFDYIGYLQRWNIYAMLKKPRVIVLHSIGTTWRTPLIWLRDYIVEKMKVYPNSEGNLILGILIGQQQNIPPDVALAFKTTGLTHIVAVSGFNMTVIATACGALVKYLGRKITNLLTLVIIFAFVVITGASASVVRAAIMAVIMIFAQTLGRQYASIYTVLIVSAIMTLQNPRIVIWDIGFQLSVAATFGVLFAFRLKHPGKPESFISETLRPTLGAIVFTAPIIAFHFGTFSLIAPVANLLVLPFVSWIMLFSALALIPVLGNAFVMPAQLLTSLILFITAKLSKVPYASINLAIPTWLFFSYYVVIFIIIYMRLQKRKNYDKLEKIITN